MTHSNNLNDAFEALSPRRDMTCYAFGVVSFVKYRNKLYMRLCDTVQSCYVWYINEPDIQGWRGLDDEVLMDELCSAYAASACNEMIEPLLAMGLVLGSAVVQVPDEKGGVH